MSLVLASVLFGIGLLLVVASAEWLVESTVGLSHSLGLTAFLISVVFIGFDPENLAVGAVASADQAAGIALGTIVGAAMVALALAFGVTAVVVSLEIERVPRRILLLPVGGVFLVSGLAMDGLLSRLDGALLFGAYAGAVVLLLYWERRGVHVAPTEAVEDEVDEEAPSTLCGVLRISYSVFRVGTFALIRNTKYAIRTLFRSRISQIISSAKVESCSTKGSA